MATDESEKCAVCGTYLIEGEKGLCDTCKPEVRDSENVSFFLAPKYRCTACSEMLTQSEKKGDSDKCPYCNEDDSIVEWIEGLWDQ